MSGAGKSKGQPTRSSARPIRADMPGFDAMRDRAWSMNAKAKRSETDDSQGSIDPRVTQIKALGPVTPASSSPKDKPSADGSAASEQAPAAAGGHPPASEPTHEQIADRAFQIYLARQGAPGDPHADWAQAERELRAEAAGRDAD